MAGERGKGCRHRPRDRCPLASLPAGGLSRGQRGASLVETLIVLLLVGLVAQLGALQLGSWRQQQELEGALRAVVAALGRVCAAAGASGRAHALLFDAAATTMSWTPVADGDGDGVRRVDLSTGVDFPTGPTIDLGRRHAGIIGGRPPGVPTVGGGAADRHGVAFGRSAIVSCTAARTARSGTLYLRSEDGAAAALRVYGPTARMTLWWWHESRSSWSLID